MTKNPAASIDAAIADNPAPSESKAASVTPHSSPVAGIACSPRHDVQQEGYGVHTAIGALVLGGPAHTDFSLAGALPLTWQRHYSSHADAAHGGFCGALGHGWRTPLELRLEVRDNACLLHDVDGRSIGFGALGVGGCVYSASEDLWLMRSSGDASNAPAWHTSPAQRRFAHVPLDLAQRPHVIFVGQGGGDLLWTFAPANRKALQDGSETTPAAQWQLLGCIDRLGRTQRYRYAPVFGSDRLVTVQDGAGRCYRLHYDQVRAPRPEPRYPSGHFWQADSGVRLTRVELLGLPQGIALQEPALLVRYVYSDEGDLVEVLRGHGCQEHVQRFAWRNHLLTFHQERGGPEHHYRYERNEPGARIVEQRSQQGLTRRFSYQTLPAEPDQLLRTKTQVVDNLKRTQSHIFKGAGGLARLVEHTRADGSTLRYGHDAHGRQIAATDTQGRTTHLRRDAMGLVTCVQHPDGSEARSEWDAATGLLQSRTDAQERNTRFHYDAFQRVERIQRADGSIERYAYPDPSTDRLIAHLPTHITDGEGGITRLAYSPEGLLQSRTDAVGHTTHYQYTDGGSLAQQTNALGEVTRYEYDGLERCVAVHLADGSSRQIERDASGRITALDWRTGAASNTASASDPATRSAAAVQWQYDLWGRVTHRQQAGACVKWAYDEAGRWSSFTNESGDTLRLRWDDMDRIVHVAALDGHTEDFRYNADGRLIERIVGCASETKKADRAAAATRYEWNAAGQLAAIHHPASGDASASERTASNGVTSANAARVTRLQWNRASELQSASVWRVNASKPDAERLLSQIELRRDRMGRVVGQTQRLLNALTGAPEFEHHISHTVDARGHRIASQLGALGRIGYELDDVGGLRCVTWQGSTQVEFERDALQRETVRSLGAGGIRRQVEWNAAGRWQHSAWSGDALPPHTTGIAAAAMRPCQYAYDHAGRVTTMHSDAATSRFAYDAHGRLIAAHTPQAGAQRWSWDAAGHRLPLPLQSSAEPHPEAEPAAPRCWTGGRVDYYTNAYDASSGGGRFQYFYDPYGNRTRTLDLHTGHAVHWEYDVAHRLVAAKGVDAQGKPFEQRYRHDALGRRLAVYHLGESGQTLDAKYFGWDEDRLVHIERHAGRSSAGATPSGVLHMVYEPGTTTPLLQLAEGDAAGAVDSDVDGDADTGVDIHADVQAGIQPATAQQPSADAVADVDTGASQSIRDMLKSLEDLDARIKARLGATGASDPHNQAFVVRQVKAAHAAHAANTARKPSPQADVADAKSGAQKQLQVGVQEDMPRAMQLRHFVTDHQGSPVALFDDQGAIVWALQHDAWGNDRAVHNPGHVWQPLRMAARYQDEDAQTGMQWCADGRCYDARLGAHINRAWRGVALSGGPLLARLGVPLPHAPADTLRGILPQPTRR